MKPELRRKCNNNKKERSSNSLLANRKMFIPSTQTAPASLFPSEACWLWLFIYAVLLAPSHHCWNEPFPFLHFFFFLQMAELRIILVHTHTHAGFIAYLFFFCGFLLSYSSDSYVNNSLPCAGFETPTHANMCVCHMSFIIGGRLLCIAGVHVAGAESPGCIGNHRCDGLVRFS